MRHRFITALLGTLIVVASVAQAPGAAAASKTSKVSASVSASKVTVGSSFELRSASPRGKFAATDRVVFQRKVSGSWKKIDSRQIGRDGRATIRVTPLVGTSYYRIVKLRTKKFRSATSRTVKVASVRRASSIKLEAGSTAVTEGSTVTFSVRSPESAYVAGDEVRLQTRRPADAWTTSKTLHLSTNGTAEIDIKPPLGTTEFRAMKSESDQFVVASSNPVAVTAAAAPTVPVKSVVAVNGPGQTLTVTASKPVADTTFSVSSGEKVTLATADITGFGPDGQPSISVRDSTGTPVDLISLGNVAPQSRWTFIAPSSGTYTLYAQGPVGAPGGLRIVVTTPLTQAHTVNGPSQLLSASGLSGRELRAAFHASAGDYVSYGVTNKANWRPNGIRLVDIASGQVVEGVGHDVNFGVWRIPSSGTYQLEFEPFSATAMASDISLSSAAPSAVALNGPTISAAVDRPGGAAVYTVPVTAGQKVTLGVTYDAVDDNGGYQVAIFDPGNYPYGGVSGPYDKYMLEAETSGTHVIIVRGTSSNTPSIKLDVTTPLVKSVLLNGPAVPVSTVGHAGRSFETEFVAHAGDIISLSAKNAVYGPRNPTRQLYNYVRLYDVDSGESVSVIDARTDYTNIWQLPRDGAFRLEFTPVAAYTFTFDVALNQTAPVPIAIDGQPLSVSIDRDGAVKAYSVEVVRGQRVTLTVAQTDQSSYRTIAFGAAPDTDIYGSGSKVLVAKWDGTMNFVVRGPARDTGAEPLRLELDTPLS